MYGRRIVLDFLGERGAEAEFGAGVNGRENDRLSVFGRIAAATLFGHERAAVVVEFFRSQAGAWLSKHENFEGLAVAGSGVTEGRLRCGSHWYAVGWRPRTALLPNGRRRWIAALIARAVLVWLAESLGHEMLTVPEISCPPRQVGNESVCAVKAVDPPMHAAPELSMLVSV